MHFDTITSLASRQHGVITRQQLAVAGVTPRRLRTEVERGVLLRATRGIYVLAGAASTWEQRLLVGQTAAGPLSVASHRSAAGLWQLDRFRRQHLEVSVPAPATRRPGGVVIHESNDLPSRDRTVRAGIPVTSPTRTIIDVSRYLSIRRLTALLDDAVRRDLTSYEAVHHRFAELAAPGRNGIATLRQVLEARPIDAAAPDSPLEDDVRSLLTGAGLPAPVLHHRVSCDDLTYVLDLAWPEQLVAVECDGFRFHRTPQQLEWDDDRRNRLGVRGWLVLHATRGRVRSSPWRLVDDVRRALARAR